MPQGLRLLGALLGVTLAIGMRFSDSWRVFSLVGTSIILGAQPAAVASIALGFHPFMGAVMSILANLMVLPHFWCNVTIHQHK